MSVPYENNKYTFPEYYLIIQNQTDIIHKLAWEKSGNNIKILKGRRPFEGYMIVSYKRVCPREFSKLDEVVIAWTGLSN